MSNLLLAVTCILAGAFLGVLIMCLMIIAGKDKDDGL